MGYRRLAFIALIIASTSGCNDKSAGSREANVKKLEASVVALEARVDKMESDASWKEWRTELDTIAYLTPGSNGYSTIRTDIGTLTFSLEDVQPYANGSRVRLRVGNVSSATITGLTLKVDWGTVDGKGAPDNENQKTKEIKLTADIRHGRWNNVVFTLEAVPPAQLGFVRIHAVTHTGIQLLY